MTDGDPAVAEHHANVRSADQRATGLAAGASLAASFALSGAAIIADAGKLRSPMWTQWAFGWILVLTVALFTLSAFAALSGHRMQEKCNRPLDKLGGAKHARVNASLWFLSFGMAGVVLMSLAATVAGIWGR